MFDIAQTFTLPGSPPPEVGVGDPPFDVLFAAIDGAPLATGGTITFNYLVNRGPATYALSWPAIMTVRSMQAVLTQDTDFTVVYGQSNITVTYLGVNSIPMQSSVTLQVPITDTSGQATVNGRVLPATAVDPNLGI